MRSIRTAASARLKDEGRVISHETLFIPFHCSETSYLSSISAYIGIPSSSIFTFNKEDHTLGNMLRSRLLQSDKVSFSGYKVPHPLEA